MVCDIPNTATVECASPSHKYVSCGLYICFSLAVVFVAGTRFYIINKPKKEAALLYLKVPLCIVVWEGEERKYVKGERGKERRGDENK